jgi:hypothetical protein
MEKFERPRDWAEYEVLEDGTGKKHMLVSLETKGLYWTAIARQRIIVRPLSGEVRTAIRYIAVLGPERH